MWLAGADASRPGECPPPPPRLQGRDRKWEAAAGAGPGAAAGATAGAPEQHSQARGRAGEAGRGDRAACRRGGSHLPLALRRLLCPLTVPPCLACRREGFLGLSVADTLRQCLRLGLKEQAQKLAREFKVCMCG